MADIDDQMAPDASPGSVRAGVRRVNNVPMYILGAVIAGFLLVMVLVASDRAKKQQEATTVAPSAAKANGSTATFANEIAGKQTNGIIAPAAPKAATAPVLPPLNGAASLPPPGGPGMPTVPPGAAAPGTIAIARPDNPDMPPAPPPRMDNPGQPVNSQVDQELQQIRQAKAQAFEAAVKASTRVGVGAARSSGSAPGGINNGGFAPDQAPPKTREEMLSRIAQVQQQIDSARSSDPTAAYQERLAQARAMSGGGGGGAGAGGGGGGGGFGTGGGTGGAAAPQFAQTSAGQGRNSYSQFGPNGQQDRWKLDSQVEAPRSRYELRTGFVVPATLISGINSELPGQIVAQVSQDVFDTATGKWKLIPQGARLVGQYSAEVGYGQSRVLVAWQRIIFPDGKALDIGSMPGGDSAGYAGFNDQVNNHYVRIFGSALLMSAITAGTAISQHCQENGTSGGGSISTNCQMSQALGQQLGNTTSQLIQKNLNISPTLEIRPGYRFNVIVTKDMTFSKPYRSFDY